MWQLLAIAAALALSSRPSDGNPGAGENAGTYGALCTLLTEALGEVDQAQPTTGWEQAYASILEANMSAAGPDWRNQFVKSKGVKQEWEPTAKHKAVAEAWARSYEDWANTAVALSTSDSDDKKKAISKFDAMNEATRNLAKRRLEAILTKVQPVRSKLNALKAIVEAGSGKAVTDLLKTALYGGTDGKTDFESASKTKDTGRVRNICRDGGKLNGQQTLGDVLLCVCVNAQSSPPTGDKKICAKTTSDHVSKQWELTTAGDVATVFNELKKGCNIKQGHKTTASGIRAALATLRDKIQIESNDGYLGKYDTDANCAGTSTSGVCVKYANYAINTGDTWHDIQWVKHATTAAAALETAARATSTMAALEPLLEAASAEAWEVANTTSVRQVADSTSITAGTITGCDAHKTNTTCTKNNCKWKETNETDGKCVADDSKVIEQATKAAGTGKGAKEEVATTGCVAHKDKTACENDKTGEKQNCAWRKGKDNENEPEKQRSRNRSFLLNNKLDLTAAAFLIFVDFQNSKKFS
uniref:Variant surface glycoprotein (VSG, atypical), putative n=1 Tax=Trypanosoma brucei brucei (strain 927/4 GUTat10.1) TaxID=185431 RepID=Q4FKK8_TRYB2|nr:variant surface glycoprotein (VSG, atypical), putative [Trypanosoma brucei brucei TREU927]